MNVFARFFTGLLVLLSVVAYAADDQAAVARLDRGGDARQFPEQDIVAARAEYMRLADTLWRSVGGEGSTPEPLPDREIFELLGFD